MDLETIIPLVIIAVAYLFKAFENARKGDKKKRPSAPRRPQARSRQAPPARPLVSGRPEEMPQTPGAQRHSGGQPVIENQQVPDAGRGPETWKTPGLPQNRETPARPVTPAAERQPEGRWWWEEMTSPMPASDKTEQPQKAERLQKIEHTLPARQPRNKTGREKQMSGGIPSQAVADPHDDTSAEYADFDLEDAVIKAVILERREF